MIIPRTVIGCSLVALALSGAIGVFHLRQIRGLGVVVKTNETPPAPALRRLEAPRVELSGAAGREADSKLVEMRGKLERAEAELADAQTEKRGLETAARAKDERIAQLEQQMTSRRTEPSPAAPADTTQIEELQAQLQDARKQIDAAEQEKQLLAEKTRVAQERSTKSKPKNRPVAGGNPGIRGHVLAVNRAYNFVVLDLGTRQGVEANSEMFVMRGSTFIGKIRVSSVEPATTIGDIVTTSLARGVQIQQGDIVVYGGTNF